MPLLVELFPRLHFWYFYLRCWHIVYPYQLTTPGGTPPPSVYSGDLPWSNLEIKASGNLFLSGSRGLTTPVHALLTSSVLQSAIALQHQCHLLEPFRLQRLSRLSAPMRRTKNGTLNLSPPPLPSHAETYFPVHISPPLEEVTAALRLGSSRLDVRRRFTNGERDARYG